MPDEALDDIRPALRERLRRAVAGRDEHAAKASEFTAEVDDLTRQLDREEARFASRRTRARLDPPEPLTDFLMKEMATEPANKDKLRQAAERHGYDLDGRSIHAALINLLRQGKIEEREDGRFGLIAKGAEVTVLRRI